MRSDKGRAVAWQPRARGRLAPRDAAGREFAGFPNGKFRKITLQYVPQDKDKSAALNFHLTGREKKDLMESVFNADNQKGFETLKGLLNNRK